MASILVCDDQRSICEMLDISLRKEGHRVETVNGGEAAKKKLSSANYELLITDIKMPQTDGIEVLRFARQTSPETSVILITAVEDYEAAVQAVKGGAFDYIHKGPGLLDELKIAVGRALQTLGLQRENFALKRDAASRNSLENIIGASPAIEKLKATIRTVAPTSSTVLIYGESGSGKELVARAVHSCSARATEPFVSINCGAFPETLLESELFGYMKGAFTGASQNKRGLFEVASGGAIFLDEIGEMSLSMQVKLLRVLQERTVRPVGGTQETPVDVRVIAATNRDLRAEAEAGRFRQDLYYRLSVFPIELPPLRKRAEDIPVLAEHFLDLATRRLGRPKPRLTLANVQQLQRYHWPGNVRELQHVIERAVIIADGARLAIELPAAPAAASPEAHPSPLRDHDDRVLTDAEVRRLEADNIRAALRRAAGKVSGAGGAAELLGIKPTTLGSRIKALGLLPRSQG